MRRSYRRSYVFCKTPKWLSEYHNYNRAELSSNFEEQIEINIEYDPDERRKVVVETVQRQGQSRFRQSLIEAYDGRCAISGCRVIETLEAAHLLSYRGPKTSHASNGILLRSDLHNLFDLDLIRINPKTMKLVVDPKLKKSEYFRFNGRSVSSPMLKMNQPRRELIAERNSQFDNRSENS